MRLVCVKGKNYKNFIKVFIEKKEDLNSLKIIEAVVSRTEFKPFIKSFDKNIRQSYLINQTFIPATFVQEISKKAIPAMGEKVIIENSDILFENIKRDDFKDWLQSIPLPEWIDLSNDAYEYQQEAVFRALLFKNAKVEVSTGGGKTFITYLYCRYLIDNLLNTKRFEGREKILIIVPRTDLCKQTALSLTKEFDILNENPIIVDTIYAGAKKQAGANIIIGNYQSVRNYDREWFDEFGVIICDEAHTAKTYSIKKDIFDKCYNTEFVFGMTGTYPEQNTLDFLNITAMFGPTVLEHQTKALTDDGVITPVKIQPVKIHYEEDKYFCRNLMETGILGTEKYRAEKVFFQSNTKRNEIIMDCISKIEGNQIILVETVQYVKDLMELAQNKFPNKKVFTIHGSVSQKSRDEIKGYMIENEDALLFATYETMSTGVNIKNIMAEHFPDGGRSKIRIKQSVGRGVRLHPKKDFLYVFDYQDDIPNSSFKTHWRERMKLYNSEKHTILDEISYKI